MYPTRNKLHRLFYWTTKSLCEERHSRLSRLFFAEQTAYLLYGLLRFFLFATLYARYITRSVNFEESPLRYDWICYMSIKYQANYDTPMTVIVAILSVFGVFGQAILYRIPADSFSLTWHHQTVVHSQEAYTAALYSREIRDSLLERETVMLCTHFREVYPLLAGACGWSLIPVSRLLARVRIWLRMDQVKKRTFLRWRPSISPNLSPTIRTRLVQWLLLVDGLCFFAQLFFALVMGLAGLVILGQFYGAVPWWNALPVAIEFPLAYLSMFAIFYLAVFFVVSSSVSHIVNVGHCREICRGMRKVMGQRRRGQMAPGAFAVHVKGFLGEYYRCVKLSIYSDGEMYSPAIFGFLLSCLPTHVYLITRIVFYTNTPIELLITWMIALMITLIAYAAMVPVAIFSDTMKVPLKYLPAVQGLLRRESGSLLLKLKLDTLEGRLVTSPFAITVGPISAVTASFIAELLYVYVGYLLMSFSMAMGLE